ncbi:MAG: phage portal protein [Bacilli bacterium]
MDYKVTFGRKRIIIDTPINENSIIDVLQKALKIHNENEKDINYLIDYYKNKQPILNRVGGTTTEVNNKLAINFYMAGIRDIVGYTYGKPIQLLPKKSKNRKKIEEFINIIDYENVSLVDMEVGLNASICGIGYSCSLPSPDISKDFTPEIPMNNVSLDPANTFFIQSSEIGNPIILTVHRIKTSDNILIYQCYDNDFYYKITCKNGSLNKDSIIEAEKNVIGINPIIPLENTSFLMGNGEAALSIFDAINQIGSDGINDVESKVKSLLVILGAQLEEDASSKIKESNILELFSDNGQQNSQLDAKFIYNQINPQSVKELREFLEESYKIVMGIPDRKTRGGGGGDTGEAVKLRDGWGDLEVVARITEMYIKKYKKRQIAVNLKVCKLLGLIDDSLNSIDIDIKLTRNQTDNLQSKVQAGSTLYGMGVSKEDTAELMSITNDISGFVNRWEETEKKENVIVNQKEKEQITNDNNRNL